MDISLQVLIHSSPEFQVGIISTQNIVDDNFNSHQETQDNLEVVIS